MYIYVAVKCIWIYFFLCLFCSFAKFFNSDLKILLHLKNVESNYLKLCSGVAVNFM